MTNNKSIRICKISFSFPTAETPGAGLSVFKPSCFIKEPTLYITPKFIRPAVDVPSHIHVKQLALVTLPIWKRLPSNKILKRIYQFFFFSEFSIRSVLPVVRFKPDVLIVGLSGILPSIALKNICNSKLILSLHNVTDVEIILQSKLFRWMIGNANTILVVSNVMKSMLESIIDNDKIVVRPTGVDLKEFRAQNKPFENRKKQIITVGSFKWKKGYPYLIHAFKNVVRNFPDYSLIIIGTGEGEKHLNDLIDEHSLQNQVRILKHLSQKQISEMLNESKLFVLASVREGFPKALIEALACGTPVVITTACNFGRSIKDVGIEVPVKDGNSLSSAIQSLLNHTYRWSQFSLNAPEVARRYSWESVSVIEESAIRSTVIK